MENLIPDLTVKFDNHGCLEVPEVSSGMAGRKAVNQDILSAYGRKLREAQNSLDRMPTYKVENPDPMGLAEADVMYGRKLREDTPEQEKALFEALRQLNAEIVLRVLVMRSLVTAGMIGQ
jgi:hypothetical protein